MWVRLYTEINRDRKLRRLSPALRWLWITMICLAKESPEPGTLLLSESLPVTVEDLADEAAISIEEVSEGIDIFINQNMLAKNEEGVFCLINWDKRQFTSDNSTERSRKHRSKQKNKATEVQQHCNVAETPPETETETDTEINKDIKSDCENPTDDQQKNQNKSIPFKSTDQRKIFNHWNSKKIIQHRDMSTKIKRAINGALDNYSPDEIIQAIDNYYIIVNGNEYYWSYKWGLKEFLQRGLEKFLDLSVAMHNYKTDKSKGRASPERIGSDVYEHIRDLDDLVE